MDDRLRELGLTLDDVKEMYRLWSVEGIPKSKLERQFIGAPVHHGKMFNRLVKRYLGIDIQRPHRLVRENERLRKLLIRNGIDPDPFPEPPPGQLLLFEQRTGVPSDHGGA